MCVLTLNKIPPITNQQTPLIHPNSNTTEPQQIDTAHDTHHHHHHHSGSVVAPPTPADNISVSNPFDDPVVGPPRPSTNASSLSGSPYQQQQQQQGGVVGGPGGSVQQQSGGGPGVGPLGPGVPGVGGPVGAGGVAINAASSGAVGPPGAGGPGSSPYAPIPPGVSRPPQGTNKPRPHEHTQKQPPTTLFITLENMPTFLYLSLSLSSLSQIICCVCTWYLLHLYTYKKHICFTVL